MDLECSRIQYGVVRIGGTNYCKGGPYISATDGPGGGDLLRWTIYFVTVLVHFCVHIFSKYKKFIVILISSPLQ